MSLIDDKVKLSNLWENFHNMQSKTTILDRIVEKEMSERNAHISRAIQDATSAAQINSKKIDAKPVVPQVELLKWVQTVTGKGKNLDISL